ncbi:MAG TPA: hypothetical protein VNT75_08675 [Symbiobacteriaceae bacterium]|nr:hypothetical protein [Symbiobacteriaceae bacterium]
MNLALHETLELLEMSALKVVSLTKAKTMQVLVSDPDLKSLLRDEADVASRQLQELDALLARTQEGEGQA